MLNIREAYGKREKSDVVAVITGGSSGIGRQLASDLAAHGAVVVIVARGIDAINDTVSAITSDGGRAHGKVCDVSDPVAVTDTFAALDVEFGHVDLLACCAGISPVVSVRDSEPEELERVVRIDLLGTMWCCRAVLPLMRGGEGDIVTFSSNIAHLPITRAAGYCASKAGIVAFSESLHLEVADLGIRVLTVYPAFVSDTRMAQEDVAVRGEPPRWLHRNRQQVSTAILKALDDRRRVRLVLPPAIRVGHVLRALAPATTLRIIGRADRKTHSQFE